MRAYLLSLTLLSLALGCNQDADSAKDITEPVLGSADSLRGVKDLGAINVGDEVTGEFSEDLSFFGYQFAALPGGVITAEITQRGSSRGLDTTLFVYGMRSSSNWERLGFDDDAGWGALSKLTVDLGTFERFMVVVGTADGMGRGNFRLTLSCDNDACIDTTRPDFSDCADPMYELYELCVQDQLENADWGYDDPAEEMSIEYCVEEGAIETQYYACESGVGGPGFCAATEAEITSSASSCESRLKEAYYIIDRIPLQNLELSNALQNAVNDFLDGQPDYGSAQVTGYKTPADASFNDVASTIRSYEERAAAIGATGPALSRDAYRATDYLPVTLLDAIEAEFGNDYVAVEFYGSYDVAAGASEWTTLRVLYFAEQNVAFGITEVAGED